MQACKLFIELTPGLCTGDWFVLKSRPQEYPSTKLVDCRIGMPYNATSTVESNGIKITTLAGQHFDITGYYSRLAYFYAG